MAENFPKLRADLEIRAESSQPHPAVVVKDPIARQFYRFTPVQATALRLMDGRSDLRSISVEVTRNHKIPVSVEQLGAFQDRLASLHLLDTPSAWLHLEKVSDPQKRPFGNVLSIKLKVFNPDSLLAAIQKRVSFCFTGGFVALVLATYAAAAIICLLNWELLFVSISGLFSIYSVPLVLAVAFAVLTAHEFAHGVALKHYGGKVEKMGFLLLYFVPAFYCDVSDSWLLRKRERMLVTLAGGFVQLFIGALAVLAWRLLAPETFLSKLCIIIFAFSGIQSLFNFNPLIRLDGYYLLSDYLEIPNLRTRAFQFLGRRMERLLLGTEIREDNPGTREQRIYWRYGTLSALFTVSLVTFMLVRIGSWLVREYQMWGLLLTSVLGLMSVQIIVNSSGIATTLRFFRAVAERLSRAPRGWLAAGLFVCASFFPWELKVAGDFVIRSTQRVAVDSQVDGTLKVINVEEGSAVKPGEVLAEIENLELKNDFEEARGELASRSASLKLLKAGTRPEEIEKARRQVETRKAELSSVSRIEKERALLQETIGKKRAELENAREVFERSKTLFDGGLISRNEYERDSTLYEVRRRELSEAQSQLGMLAEKVERDLQVKKKEVDEAESSLNILLAGTRVEAIEAAEAEVTKLLEKVKILEQQLDLLRIRSTISGIVATRHLRDRLGEYIRKGDFFCEIVHLGTMIVEMPVPEKEIADVHLGYPITLKVRGYPNDSFEGRVTGISPIAIEDGPERKILIQSELDNNRGLLRTGMTGVGKILCGKRMIAHLLTRRTVRWLRTEFWEYLP